VRFLSRCCQSAADWSWVDALFMSMNVYSRLGRITGNASYYEKQWENFRDAALAPANNLTTYGKQLRPMHRAMHRAMQLSSMAWCCPSRRHRLLELQRLPVLPRLSLPRDASLLGQRQRLGYRCPRRRDRAARRSTRPSRSGVHRHLPAARGQAVVADRQGRVCTPSPGQPPVSWQ
jgi:hypothetical protein